MSKFKKWKLCLISIGMLILESSANASPWPIEASIAYVEELQLACAKLQPNGRGAFAARKEFLYSESPDRVKDAMASKDYEQARIWARDAVGNTNESDLAVECTSFLTNSNLALTQVHPRKEEQMPVSQ